MFLAILLTSLFFPTYHSSAYALIDLNALSTNHDQAQVVVVAETAEEENSGVEKVEVKHRQKGMLLALWPITFTVRVVVWPDGTVKLFYPWYSAITVDHQEEIETRLKVAVDNALKAKLVGSVKAEGASPNPQFTASEASTVKRAVEKSLSSSLTKKEKSAQ